MKNKYSFFIDEITKIKAADQYRFPANITQKNGNHISINEKEYLNLSSNDYLGISTDKKLIQEFIDDISNNDILKNQGIASASSRLLTGNSCLYTELENELAKLYGREASLVFNSGYHANIGIIPALTKKGDVIFSDKLNHASIIDGMKLSDADFHRYKHLDYDNLKELLGKHRGKYNQCLIITESIFSMDGDRGDLKKLIELKEEFKAILIVDEAHSTGLFGKKGCGVCEEDNVIDKIDIIIGTFGKAFGSAGAYAIMDNVIREYLFNKMRSLIFTTAMSPINLLWTLKILRLIPSLAQKRQILKETSTKFRNLIRENGLETKGESQIIPVILGNNDKTVQISNTLKNHGFWILPIRPPTVPIGASRLRISLTSEINFSDIMAIPEIIRREIN